MEPFWMLGRMDYSVNWLLDKYDLTLVQRIDDWETLLLTLSTKVNDYDREFCIRMAEASKKYHEEASNSSLNQFQADYQRKLGGEEAKFILNNYPDYANKILEERDFSEEMAEAARRRRKETMRNVYIGTACICLIVLAIVIYNLPFFAEQRAYDKVKDEYDNGSFYTLNSEVENYLYEYPDGRHKSDVLFMPVKFVKNSRDIIQILDAVDNYLRLDKGGAYTEECRSISDSIWNIEIARYEKLASTAASKKGAEFVTEMLRYMQKNNVRTIEVEGVPHIDLKEYSDYPAEHKILIETLTSNATFYTGPGKKPKIPDDIVSIKDKISQKNAYEWVSYIITALQSGFDKVLTPGFIKVTKKPHTLSQEERIFPKAVVNYTVKNQEVAPDIPDIWIHESTYGKTVVNTSLFLGIGMEFNALFSLPGTGISYDVESSGDAGSDDIKGVDEYSAYGVMCERCTQEFAAKIAG